MNLQDRYIKKNPANDKESLFFEMLEIITAYTEFDFESIDNKKFFGMYNDIAPLLD